MHPVRQGSKAAARRDAYGLREDRRIDREAQTQAAMRARIRALAAQIHDEAQLTEILSDVPDSIRRAQIRAEIEPFLTFPPYGQADSF